MIPAQELSLCLWSCRCNDRQPFLKTLSAGVFCGTRQCPLTIKEQSFPACALICHISAGKRVAARVHRMTNQENRLYGLTHNPLYRFRLTGPCHSLRGCNVTSALENRSSFPLFNGNHRQEGKESTRDASGTRMPPPSGRHRHRFYSESHARGKVIDRTDSPAQAKSGQYLAGTCLL